MLPEFLRKKENLIYLVLIIAGAMMLATLTAPRKAHAGTFGLDVEGSVGVAATSDQVKNLFGSGQTADFSQFGGLVGIGAGLKLESNSMMAEVFGRYSYMNEVGDFTNGVTTATVASNNLIDTGVRLGWRPTKQTTLYGEGGYAWENLNLDSAVTGLPNKNPAGWFAGLGVDHMLGNSNWKVGAEYQHVFFSEQNVVGSPVTPDANIFRIKLGYEFGTQKQSIFTDNLPEPKSEACDPKLFNCHAPLK